MIDKTNASSVVIAGQVVECLMFPFEDFRIVIDSLPQVIPALATDSDVVDTVNCYLRTSGAPDCSSDFVRNTDGKFINVITLEQFTYLLGELSINDDPVASEMLKALTGASLHSVVTHRFNRSASPSAIPPTFHPLLVNWLRLDGFVDDEAQAGFINEFKAHAGLRLVDAVLYDADELQILATAEVRYAVLRRAGITHNEALKFIG